MDKTPPEQCDLCNKTLANQKGDEPTWVDGRINGRSSWSDMCEQCHREYGAGIGLGLGQRYRVSDGQKVEG
jgi:uncharacterized protein with PIN domain